MKKVLMALFAAMVIVSCARTVPVKDQQVREPDDPTIKARALMNDKQFPEAVSELESMLRANQNTTWAPQIIYLIATAYISSDNPQKDYALALSGFDEFLLRYPEHERAADARNWRTIIKQLLDAKKENERLNKNLHQLRQLDVKQEEKRLGK